MIGLGDIYASRQDAAEHAGGFFDEVDDTIECCDLCGATAPVDVDEKRVIAEWEKEHPMPRHELEETPCE